jgi:gluconokinase
VVVVVMGPSGSGKSVVGAALAHALGWPFLDADDLHPASNVAKMRAGEPLDEDDRRPWLQAVRRAIDQHLAAGRSAVVACSALRASYREALGAADPRVRFVLLSLAPERLAERLAERRGHFMPASLLPSQLAVFEGAADLLAVDASRPVAEVVTAVRDTLGL